MDPWRTHTSHNLHFALEQLCIDGDNACSSPHNKEDMDEMDGVLLS